MNARLYNDHSLFRKDYTRKNTEQSINNYANFPFKLLSFYHASSTNKTLNKQIRAKYKKWRKSSV